MSQEKRSAALVHATAAMLFAVVLSACSAGRYSAVSVQTPDAATRASDSADPAADLPEIVVTATRLPSPRMAEQTSPQLTPKRRG